MFGETPPGLMYATGIPDAIRRLEKVDLGIQDPYFCITLGHAQELREKVGGHDRVIIQPEQIIRVAGKRIAVAELVSSRKSKVAVIADRTLPGKFRLELI